MKIYDLQHEGSMLNYQALSNRFRIRNELAFLNGIIAGNGRNTERASYMEAGEILLKRRSRSRRQILHFK